MFRQNLYLDAIESVLAQDLPDDAIPAAIASQTAFLSECRTD